MKKSNILFKLRKKLLSEKDEKYKKGVENFFKEKIKVYGVRIPVVRKIAKEFYPKKLEKKEIFKLAEELLKTNHMENAFIAFDWIYRKKKEWEKKDFKFFEKIVKNYIDNWAKCDDFCGHSLGSFLLEYPEFIKKTEKWTKNKNLWVRRVSAVCLIPYARRKPEEIEKIVFKRAKLLLEDKEDLVQKAYGWLLKELANKKQKKVFNWVMKNRKKMPRTALRYAIEKMPKPMKIKAMS